jgi:Domain of unknown function (DUF5666)
VNRWNRLVALMGLSGLLVATAVCAQEAPAQNPDSGQPQQQGQGRNRGGQNGERPLFGKITAIHDGAIEIARQDGQTVTVKVTAQTEFHKDRQAAKLTDFKVGDTIIVRGDENPDHTVTAKMIGGRTGGPGGPGGPGSGGGMMGAFGGTLGKDYVAGEVKSLDPPKMTVLRTDNVTQTIELNEDTTLRRGRDSITMADIQVGDHVMAHGAFENNMFVPKGVMVMNAEQWKRMQDFMSQANSGKPGSTEAPAPKQ